MPVEAAVSQAALAVKPAQLGQQALQAEQPAGLPVLLADSAAKPGPLAQRVEPPAPREVRQVAPLEPAGLQEQEPRVRALREQPEARQAVVEQRVRELPSCTEFLDRQVHQGRVPVRRDQLLQGGWLR